MRLCKIIFVCIIIVCIIAGFGQTENLKKVWREYKSFYKYFHYEDDYYRMGDFSLPEKIAAKDPEAAAVIQANLLAVSDLTPEQVVEALLEIHEKHPDNEYILSELIRHLSMCQEVIDPLIALGYTGKLIKLNPDNANYHLMKCEFLLDDQSQDNITPVLDELKRANDCEQYQWPGEQYEQRVWALAQQAGFGRYMFRRLSGRISGYPYFHTIDKNLTAYANRAFADGKNDYGLQITDELKDMSNFLIKKNAPHYRYMMIMNLFGSAYSFGYWNNPQGLELQRANITQEQANDNRLKLCTIVSDLRTIEPLQKKEKYEEEIWNVSLSTPLTIHSGKMFIAVICSVVIILLLCLRQGLRQKVKVNIFAIILFTLSCFYFFCVSNILFVITFWERLIGSWLYDCHRWIPCMLVFRPEPLWYYIKEWNFFDDEEALIFGLILTGPFIAALVLWGLGFLRPRKGAFWRFWYLRILGALLIGTAAGIFVSLNTYGNALFEGLVVGVIAAVLAWVCITFAWWLIRARLIKLFLITTFMGTVTFIFCGMAYIQYIPMVIFVLIAALVANIKQGTGSIIKSAACCLSKNPRIVELRKKCLILVVPFIAVYWLIFITLVPFTAKAIEIEYRPDKYSIPKIKLPQAEQAYNEILNKFQQEEFSKRLIDRYLGLVMPKDLPQVLTKLKETEFTSDYGSFNGLMPDIPGGTMLPGMHPSKREEPLMLNDFDLAVALRSCGRDVVGIITSFMDNPDMDHALVARANLGDKSAKKKLQELFHNRLNDKDENIDDPNQPSKRRKVEIGDVLGALACVSEPEQAVQYFLDYMKSQTISKLVNDDYYFFNNIKLLPTEQARGVIKAYLAKLSGYQPPKKYFDYDMGCFVNMSVDEGEFKPDREQTLNPLRELVGLYGDRQIAEEIFKMQLLADEDYANEDYVDTMNISQYFTAESIPLLKKGLLCKNSRFKAWCLWQLRKVNYEWTDKELDVLCKDENWYVRTNAEFVQSNR